MHLSVSASVSISVTGFVYLARSVYACLSVVVIRRVRIAVLMNLQSSLRSAVFVFCIMFSFFVSQDEDEAAVCVCVCFFCGCEFEDL